jgi:hypothetical protein
VGGIFRSAEVSLSYTEGLVYSAAAAISSLCAAAIGQYQVYLNRGQVYEWTLYELSFRQRQVILLTILSIGYTVIGGFLFGSLEGWDFDDAV